MHSAKNIVPLRDDDKWRAGVNSAKNIALAHPGKNIASSTIVKKIAKAKKIAKDNGVSERRQNVKILPEAYDPSVNSCKMEYSCTMARAMP